MERYKSERQVITDMLNALINFNTNVDNKNPMYAAVINNKEYSEDNKYIFNEFCNKMGHVSNDLKTRIKDL